MNRFMTHSLAALAAILIASTAMVSAVTVPPVQVAAIAAPVLA